MESEIKLTEEELSRMNVDELRKRLWKGEQEKMALIVNHGSLMKEVNRRMQVHLLEIRGLKEVNQRLQDDNQELRDLCCFLDDDRQKGRKLAREWQRFGRYTASVMRSEVSTYQNKLKDLETKQEQLLQDNQELKELCIFLDQERVGCRNSLCSQCSASLNSATRDQGDGSSSAGSNSSPTETKRDTLLSSKNRREISELRQKGQRGANINEQTLHYIKELEEHVRHLEDEKKQVAQFAERNGYGDAERMNGRCLPKSYSATNYRDLSSASSQRPNICDSAISPRNLPTKPEAVVRAMKVLEVHEQLDRLSESTEEEHMNDKEIAIVREMCNVVWRKLGDNTTNRKTSTLTGSSGTDRRSTSPTRQQLPRGRVFSQ